MFDVLKSIFGRLVVGNQWNFIARWWTSKGASFVMLKVLNKAK